MASSNVTTAVIVAAGRSSRLQPVTDSMPKGLLEVSGEAMLRRSVRLLRRNGVEHIAIVVGFCREKIQTEFANDGISFIFNPFFAETNNSGSLWFAREWLRARPFLYLHSDIVYDESLLRPMLTGPDASLRLLIDHGPTDAEAMKVRLDGQGRFVESNKQMPAVAASGEWVGMASVPAEILPALFETLDGMLAERLFQAYDTEAFNRLAAAGTLLSVVSTDDAKWIEVDTAADLRRANALFTR